MQRRILTLALGAALAGLGAPSSVLAQDYPNRPIKWVVGYPAGGGSDMVARVIADKLQQVLGQAIVIENKPGATTSIAARAVASASPDGYTLFSPDNGTLVNNPMMFKKLPYDPVADFAPVSMIVRMPMLLVAHPGFPANDVRSFVELLKRNPGKYPYASPGKGTPHHLAMEAFKSRAGIDAPDVAYKGGAQAVQDVLANQVPFMVLDGPSAAQHLQAGKLKALAVISQQRLERFPDIPAIGEAGFKDLDVHAWQGVVMPAGTPRAIINKVHAGLVEAIGSPETQNKLRSTGMEPVTSTPEAYAAKIKSESAIWHPFIKQLNIQLD